MKGKPLNERLKEFADQGEWDRAAIALIYAGWTIQAAYLETLRQLVQRPEGV